MLTADEFRERMNNMHENVPGEPNLEGLNNYKIREIQRYLKSMHASQNEKKKKSAK